MYKKDIEYLVIIQGSNLSTFIHAKHGTFTYSHFQVQPLKSYCSNTKHLILNMKVMASEDLAEISMPKFIFAKNCASTFKHGVTKILPIGKKSNILQ